MSFVVEIPSVFKKPTQIPVRLGNTILTGNETIEGTLSVNESVDISNNLNVNGLTTLNDVSAQNMELSGSLDVSQNVTIGGTLGVTGNVGIGGSSGSETLLVSGSERVTSDLHVNGDLVVDGTVNFSEVVFSTQLEVSNQGTGPALKVSQFGVGDDQDVALFNAGDEGDALKIDSCGNSHFYKHVNVSGTMTSNSPWALLGQTIDGDSDGDYSGHSVSINAKGDIVAIGAIYDVSGTTKIYQYTNGSWNQLGQTIDGDSDGDRSGSSVSINAKGDIVAIGAIYDVSGSTKMYQYTDGSWNQLGETIYGDSNNARSGSSVSINAKGDIVAIGAYLDVSGSTKMYQYTDGSWNQLGETIYGDSNNDWSGYSVSINAKGDIVAIGAIFDDNNLKTDSGSTKMYQYTDGLWKQLGQTIDGDSDNDRSGYSVSINAKGDIVAIGAYLDVSGSTKMYQYTNGSWNQLGETIFGDSNNDWSGYSVSINAKGDIVAIGARLDDNSNTDSGSTKMYQYTDGLWKQLGQTIDGDSDGDRSGSSVSINAKGDIVAIGATFVNTNSGSTKIYQKGLRGNVTIEDDLSVGGDLIVNGGIYTDNFSVADTTGHTTIGGDLQLGSIPNVEQKIIDISNNSGSISYISYDSDNDKIVVEKDMDLSGSLDVSQNVTIGGTLGVTGNVTIEDDLSVGGDLQAGGITCDGTLQANGGITCDGTLQANGGITCDGTLQANGGTTSLIGNVGIGGPSGPETLLVSGSERVTGDLHVNGPLQAGEITCHGPLQAGEITCHGTLQANGGITCVGTLQANGGITCDSTLQAGGITCHGTLQANGGITCDGTLQANGGITCDGTLQANGGITCDSTLQANGGITCHSTLQANGRITCDGTLQANGGITWDGPLQAIGGTTSLIGNVGIGGNLHVNGDLVVDGTFNFSEVIQQQYDDLLSRVVSLENLLVE